MTFVQFSNKIKNFVLSLEQKRRLYTAICDIVYNAIKPIYIKVPQDIDGILIDDDITGTTFEEVNKNMSRIQRSLNKLSIALIKAGIINDISEDSIINEIGLDNININDSNTPE